MVRRLILSSLVSTTVGLNLGCVGDGVSTAMSRTRDLFRPGADRSSEELSPEFLEARRTFRKNTEKNLLAWARYQEDVGEYAEAMKKYREITIAYPECVDAHLGMARIERTTGRVSQAEQILTDLADRFPDNVQVRLELSQLYSSQEQWDKCIASCEAACRIAPHDQSCRYELGIVLARAGQLQSALPHLTFAVGAPAAHYNVAFILHQDGNDAEAARWLNQALSLHPDAKTAEKSRMLLASLPKEYASEAIHGTLAQGAVASERDGSLTERPPRKARRASEGNSTVRPAAARAEEAFEDGDSSELSDGRPKVVKTAEYSRSEDDSEVESADAVVPSTWAPKRR